VKLKEDTFTIDYYNQSSKTYDYSRRAGDKTVKLLEKLLSPITNANVLDIGSGTGNFLVELENISGQLFGIDISVGMLAQAKNKSKKSSLILGNAVRLPFISESFDAAYSIQILHHILCKDKLMEEVYRTLKSEGRFVIQSCSHEQLSTFWFYYYFPRGLEIDRKRVPDFKEIKHLLVEAGFRNISIHPCPFEIVFKETPELYLDKRYRAGASTFSLLTAEEIEEGCRKIREDISSGRAKDVVAEYDRQALKMGGRVSFIRCIKP
jgi:ubiquinone/menaquinone biosynthesis C-methylase UbiE